MIQKGLVYSVLVTIVTALYLVFVLLIGRVFQGLTGYQSSLVNLIAMFTIAVAFNPLRNWIQQILDKFFFQGTLESLSREKQRLQQELFHKEKLAYVGQLASSVAHEIRNPLTAIDTFVRYLPQRQNDPEFIAKFKTLIPSELDRIKSVVNKLLDLSRPGALKLRPTNICSVIDATLGLLEEQLALKKINVKKEYGSTDLELALDEEQMKQVFLNIFLNAIQAMDEGGSLTVNVSNSSQSSVSSSQQTDKRLPTTDHRQPKTKFISITITDTGRGISPEHLKNLFTPFHTTKEEGIGLGLVISQEIIREHGGEISVESKVDVGTKFTIELPRK